MSSHMSLEVATTLAPKIGFASHQNSVAILQDLTLENTSEEPVTGLSVTLSSSPGFLESKTWRIDQLSAGASLRIKDRNLNLNPGYLAGLTESVIGDVIVEVRLDELDEPVLAERHKIELLAKNQWGGTGSMPELLAAFCMPNDPAVDRILKSASDVLRRAGKESEINGYGNRSRSRTWELASAIWSAVADWELSYAYPPASFEQQGQKIRTPGAILNGRVATCLDTALLFAAALEQAGLNPLIIISEGHAFTGVWLQPQEFSQLTTDEAAAVRKRVELQEMIVFETSLATNTPPASFSTSIEVAKKKLSDEEFIMAIDIRRARMRRIRPLGLSNPAPDVAGQEETPVHLPQSLEEAPALPAFDVEIQEEPTSASDRVTQWQRKLLDLTARNRLLHLPERSKHVPLVCPDPGELEDVLAAGKAIRISAVPDLESGGRDMDLYAQQNRSELYEQYAKKALESNEVLSTLPQKKLESELVDLYRKARTDLDEGGANTLFLALGMLKWKKTPEDPRTYRAPLILMPVTLNRKSAISGIRMTAHEDEPRFNLTLLEMLKQDFQLQISGLDGDLPEDECGIDVEGVWNRVRIAVKEMPGFEVTTDTVIGTFSFSKYLMWKDLTDRKDELAKNPVVKHLLERGEEKFVNEESYPEESKLDHTINPAELFTPLPADSSQIAAVMASVKGYNFVLDGPPGTGKSQTIANMIVQNLAYGRRVLFVAEKMAALGVVHRRLAEHGLAEFCLEVHSNKTSKKDILQQLDKAWMSRGNLTAEEWAEQTERLRTLRDRLNSVCARLHKRHQNGLSIHDAIGRVTRDYSSSTPRLRWAEGTRHSAEEFASMCEIARRMDLNLGSFRDAPREFSIVEKAEWSNGWQESVLATAKSLLPAILELFSRRDDVTKACQFGVNAESLSSITSLGDLVRAVLATHQKDLAFAFAPDAPEKVEAARRLVALVSEYREEERKLSVSYVNEAVRKIDIDGINGKWIEAEGKFWFLAIWAKNSVAKELAAQGGTTGNPDVSKDLPHLRQMKALLLQVDALISQTTTVSGCSGIHSDPPTVRTVLDIASQLQQKLSALVSSPDELITLKGEIRRLVLDANEMLAPEGTISLALRKLMDALKLYHDHFERLVELCVISEPSKLSVRDVESAARSIVENETRLRSWCAWMRVRQEAIQRNLEPIVSAVEEGRVPQGEVESVFMTSYSKWFAAEAIDHEPILRDFVAVEHMATIEDFRRVDDKVAQLAAEYARTVLSGRLPNREDVGRRDGYGILKRELQKKRSHKPLRKLATEMGEAFNNLAPCMLMSPLSIAQYLPPDQELFDLVIFDEASQITPWDAVGSIARGRQVVVAGDPRQMPPTNFFQRGPNEAEFDGDVESDLESILDECLAVGIPQHSLNWHYRSRHESLITFSNHAYYGNKLVTFPAAETRESAVIWRRLHGVYAKGKGQTNQVEAEAMVAEAVKRMTDPEFIASGQTLAIITLNSQQQSLVADLLDRARAAHPEIERYFADELSEPVKVQNLETVQGDERDVILLGICYGPTELGAGTMSMNFGPLNRDGGERRLNVALTRSRREMMVFTSFDPSMIDLNRTSARAIRDLKHFLEFADRGPTALAEAVHGSMGGYESPFEEAVAERLRNLGWEVVSQVGVSRFRIDLGIVHPDRPGDFLVGVECDGATYHRSATAKDRDKVRASVLEGLGWTLLRVWSTDWFVDPAGETERLHAGLEALLQEDRTRVNSQGENPTDQASTPNDFAITPDDSESVWDGVVESIDETVEDVEEALPEIRSAMKSGREYEVVDFSDFIGKIDPVKFHETHYERTLVELVRSTLEVEAPIELDLLIQRVARAHGLRRSGRLIRDRLTRIVEENFHIQDDPAGGLFAWIDKTMGSGTVTFRTPAEGEPTRSIEQIASEEIRAVALCLGEKASPVNIARILGNKRLTTQGRTRIEAALQSSDREG